jgi:hypothetical protein
MEIRVLRGNRADEKNCDNGKGRKRALKFAVDGFQICSSVTGSEDVIPDGGRASSPVWQWLWMTGGTPIIH